jgi:hypothetical protein
MKTPHIHAAFPSKDMPYSRDDEKGITMRDYFAAKAMQSLSEDRHIDRAKPSTQRNIAVLSYQMADAMMEARDAK